MVHYDSKFRNICYCCNAVTQICCRLFLLRSSDYLRNIVGEKNLFSFVNSLENVLNHLEKNYITVTYIALFQLVYALTTESNKVDMYTETFINKSDGFPRTSLYTQCKHYYCNTKS